MKRLIIHVQSYFRTIDLSYLLYPYYQLIISIYPLLHRSLSLFDRHCSKYVKETKVGNEIYRFTLTCSAVSAESVSVGALAHVTTRRVLAYTNAKVVILEFCTLVYIAAGSIVGAQPESSLASACITAPDVQAHVLTQSWCALTLVDVLQTRKTIYNSEVYPVFLRNITGTLKMVM